MKSVPGTGERIFIGTFGAPLAAKSTADVIAGHFSKNALRLAESMEQGQQAFFLSMTV